jgi:hypothetical protein
MRYYIGQNCWSLVAPDTEYDVQMRIDDTSAISPAAYFSTFFGEITCNS